MHSAIPAKEIQLSFPTSFSFPLSHLSKDIIFKVLESILSIEKIIYLISSFTGVHSISTNEQTSFNKKTSYIKSAPKTEIRGTL